MKISLGTNTIEMYIRERSYFFVITYNINTDAEIRYAHNVNY